MNAPPLIRYRSQIDRVEGRLLNLAALFLALYCLALTLAPAVRSRSWNLSTGSTHWIIYLVWLVSLYLARWQCAQRLPGREPYLLPLAGMLTGWGLLTIDRLYPNFGLRQAAWVGIASAILIAGLRLPPDLRFLRRYKYLWLTGGLLLTALTLVFGVNPLGYGPQMWLGCCGIYLQPAEPLKLLLIIYLSAYLADRLLIPSEPGEISARRPLMPLLAPALIMTGLATFILAIQRDLGTALILLFFYAVMVYIASGKKQVLLFSAVGMVLAGLAAYWLFGVVRIRIDAWLNPWSDPSGNSYQIVQSLLAVANGGLPGRGPGLGSPGLVPVPHSDFIFTAITEETGLVGAVGLLVILGLVLNRGLRTALSAPDTFRRYLAVGLTAYLVGQSILIIGGNIRLLPLTGVTLPFVSYGGSSLVVSYIALLLLLLISNSAKPGKLSARTARPYLQFGGLMLVGLGALAAICGWWAIYRAPSLLARTDNARRSISDRYVRRGSILDRRDRSISATSGLLGSYERQVGIPALSAVIGYIHPVYGQTGLENGFDRFLRGLSGNSPVSIWWYHLLYGQPPSGVDIRTTLDLELQQVADEALQGKYGAAVVLNAQTGEILAMASSPGFDANKLGEDYDSLQNDPNAPLLNRSTQGMYPPGSTLGAFLMAQVQAQGKTLPAINKLDFQLADRRLECARPPTRQSLAGEIQAGCPGTTAALGEILGSQALFGLFKALGLYTQPTLPLPVAEARSPDSLDHPAWAALGQAIDPSQIDQALRLSPVQMVRAAAVLSNGGAIPPIKIVLATHPMGGEWTRFLTSDQSSHIFSSTIASTIANEFGIGTKPYWGVVSTAPNGEEHSVTWFVGGTRPDTAIPSFAVAVLLEEANPALAESIGTALLETVQGLENHNK